MSSQPGQPARAYMEQLPHGNSQIHPDTNSQTLPVAPTAHPNITAYSMAYHWEHLLSRERNRSRNLEYWVGALQTQVQKSEANFDNLKQEHERLLILVQRHSCKPAQNSPTSPYYDCEAKALSPTVFMPPPFRPTAPKANEASQGIKRKLDVPTGPCKRARNLALNVDQPISPKTTFSPSTPLAMNIHKMD